MSGFPEGEARAHIERLSSRHHVDVRAVKKMWDSEALVSARTVVIPDPTTPMRYLIALHEFGHLLDKVSAMVVNHHEAACEAAAWAWAVDHARPALLAHLTARDWHRVGHAWATCLADAVPRVR